MATTHTRTITQSLPDADRGELYPEFRRVALAAPHAIAVVGHDDTEFSYADLLASVDAAAERLAAELDPDDVLGLAVDDPLTFVSLYLAAARNGTVIVLLEGRLTEREHAENTDRFDLTALAVDHGGPGVFRLKAAPGHHPGRDGPVHAYEPEDFVVHRTSGSTGEPKGIVMSQAAVSARVRLWNSETEMTSADMVLCALPLHHCHGIDVLTLPALLTGATVVFARAGRLTGRGLAHRISTHQVTVVSGLPLMYQLLTSASGVSPEALGSLRLAVSGSAPLGTDTQERFLKRYGFPLRQVYGLSEIAVICFDRSYVGRGSIGLPIAGVEYRLEPAHDTGSDGKNGDGDLHELHVRGPALARGYYRDPEADREMFRNGWLRTHDLVRVEPEGWYLAGRRSTFINVAGNKVSPLEVEAALRECPGVLDSAVVGVPDARSTERVTAVLVTGDGFELVEVRRRLSGLLLSHQLPQRYETVSALPRTQLGKTDYAAVRRLVRTHGRDNR